jgi:tRNA(fMet)-specific endonuclease VapC
MISLDTNAVIVMINDPASQARARFDAEARAGERLVVSSIVLFELCFGIANSRRRDHNAETLSRFLSGPINILDFDADDAREAGDIRAALHRAGTPIGPYDILIAAQARRRGATLVTANGRKFARVPGLKTEDWAAA